jgi:hypothetical protein
VADVDTDADHDADAGAKGDRTSGMEEVEEVQVEKEVVEEVEVVELGRFEPPRGGVALSSSPNRRPTYSKEVCGLYIHGVYIVL